MKKNIFANVIGRFWSILSNFLFIPLYIRYLGFESYAIISYSLVIAGLMAILDVGLTATLSREFSRIDNSLFEKNRIFRTLETIYFIIIGLCILCVFCLSTFIAEYGLNLKTVRPEIVSYLIEIISFDIGFQLLLRFYSGGLLGLEKQVKANVYQVGWGVLRNGLVVIAIIFVPTLEVFFVWQAVSTLIFVIVFRLSLNKELTGKYKFDLVLRIEKTVFKKIWRFAGGMLLISLVAALNTQMDKMAISTLLPIESLGYYTLAVSLATGILIVVNPISIALLPRFTALYSSGNTVEASKLYNKVNLIVAILVFSIMANMAFFAKELIWIWTGNMKLAEQAFVFIPIISFSFAMLSLATIPYNIAIANGYTKLNYVLGLISLIITLPSYWFITKIYGALGAAVVSCIVQTFITLIYIYVVNVKFLNGKKVSDLFLKQMLFPLILAVLVAFGFSFMPSYVEKSRVIGFVWIGSATIFTIVISSILLFSKDEKIKIKNSIFKLKMKNNAISE